MEVDLMVIYSCNDKNIFFAGDTAYTEKWKFLIDENIDVTIIPVDRYISKYYYHYNPDEALKLADEFLKTKYFIPNSCQIV